MALELEQIQPWDGQSGTGAEVRGALNRNFEKLKDLSILAGMPIKDLFTSVDLLPRPGISGNNYLVGENLYVWSESVLDYVDIGSVKGQDGLDGIDGKDSKQVTTVAYDGTRPVLRLLTDGSGVSYPVPTFSKSDGSTTTIITEAATYTNAEALSSKVDKGGSDKTLKQVEDEIVQLAGEIKEATMQRTINLFDKTAVTNGVYLIGTGLTKAHLDYWTSDYIPIVAGKSYIVNKTFTFAEQFDSNKNFIPNTYSAGAGQTIFVAAQNGFIRISEVNTVSIIGYQLEEGAVSTAYQDYYIEKYATNFDLKAVKATQDATVSLLISKEYGEKSKADATLVFSGDISKVVATTLQSSAEMAGYINNLFVKVTSAGTVRILIGLIDQRNQIVNARAYDVPVQSGSNSINLLNKKIFIAKNEQVIIYVGYDGVAKVQWGNNAIVNNNQMIYGDVNGALSLHPTQYGGKLALSWDIVNIDSVFAQKLEVSAIDSKVSQQAELTSQIGIVADRLTGAKYKQVVVGGVLQLIPMQYKKVLILGNSLTNHPLLPSIGWYGDGYAMAASVRENSWDYLLQRILAQKQPTAVVNTLNIYDWEMNPNTVNLSTLLDASLTTDIDCVIFRAGENGAYIADYANGVDRLVTHVINKVPSADVLMTDMFWRQADKESAIITVANKYGLSLISTDNVGVNRCVMGDYSKGSDGILRPIIHEGVALHTNDVGFYLWSNILANFLGYEVLDELNQITYVDTGAIGYTAPTQWVKGGIVSVHTTATSVSAVDSASNPITVTNHQDGVFTFVMPNTSATVTLI